MFTKKKVKGNFCSTQNFLPDGVFQMNLVTTEFPKHEDHTSNNKFLKRSVYSGQELQT